MAVRIKFDQSHNAELPTFVLATRSGRLLGQIPLVNPTFKDVLNGASSSVFTVYKEDCIAKIKADDKVQVTPISLHALVNSTSGRTRTGELDASGKGSIGNYFSTPEIISNLVIRIVGENTTTTIQQENLSYSYDSVQHTLTVTRNNTEVLFVDSDGFVFINNAAQFSLASGESYLLTMTFTIPAISRALDFWEQIKDFKLVWVREWNKWFEAYVEVNESNSTTKNVTLTSLGEAELSQINLYNIEINTETDIDRDDYVVTTLFNETNAKASLLNRIMEKAPHYHIAHVDSTIANIQRTFSFNGKSIYDAFKEISDEEDILFQIDCYSDADGHLVREINVYDLESYCYDCGHRGDFIDKCDECGSTNIKSGYGDDTTIFVSVENLADNIKFTTDNGSVKNCFRLEAGDDLMSATVANCNPNGSRYIWYISDETKSDMSDTLVAKLEEYDTLYRYYQNEHEVTIDADLLEQYNDLIDKYSVFTEDYSHLSNSIVGFPALMQAYYDTIDFFLFLNDTLMPSVEISRTTAGLQAAELNTLNLSPVAVQKLQNCSAASATNAVLAMAKTIVDPRYQVKVKDSTFAEGTWIGTFTVTNYSDDEDTATTGDVHVTINDDYEKFVKQKIDKILSKKSEEVTDIVGLFKLSLENFIIELRRYSLSRLSAFSDCCQSCIDILIEQGIADSETWADKNPDMYRELYVPFYQKLGAINDEMALRESEIEVIAGVYDKDGDLATHGVQTYLGEVRTQIQNTLNFENYLGETLWLEFVSYRREDTYNNSNYISDGLNNSELFDRAIEFVKVATKEIYKSATLQHSISASLKNLLVMKEFEPLLSMFEIGNWLKIRVDGKVYKLRLIEYEINYDNLQNLNIRFSDVKNIQGAISDIESVVNQASSMATSYDAVMHQASAGKKSHDKLNDWVNKGLALTKMKIIDSADNQNITWDSHGLLCREYLPITDDYDVKQLKIINKGLFLTDDNWQTSKAGIGNFVFYNPETGEMEEAYGVIADTLIGNLVLSEKVGIYNQKNSITLDENGITITADGINSGQNNIVFSIQKKEINGEDEEVITRSMYIDSNGNLVLNGSIKINSAADQGISTLDELTDASRYTEEFSQIVYDELHGENGVYSTIDAVALAQQQYTDYMLNEYRAEVGQYMTFDENGLTLGAISSTFRTVIDNQRLAFYDGDQVAAYISNNQLFIPNAVIQSALAIGNFFFIPRTDGGVSLTWKDEE